ncbi:MAG TPA: ligase-associated DNA damage response endonuclease PdeM [Gemmatimonadaceae bacterium]|nr:ligase-associated DNA damage response endonuclease PdeM [Gemmatimonadaceae bacterium]
MTDNRITIQGEEVSLLPERAAYWHKEKALLVADPHWGKAATFRAEGIPVPSGTTREAIERLSSIIHRTDAERVIFLGDLLHAKEGRSQSMFTALREWRDALSNVEVVLVRGNHDRRAGDPPLDLRITCVDAPFPAPPFLFAHHPVPSDDGYVIAGHIHPAIRLSGRARQSARLPCFLIGDQLAILPAFGDFTGVADIDPAPEDRVFAIVEDDVIELDHSVQNDSRPPT